MTKKIPLSNSSDPSCAREVSKVLRRKRVAEIFGSEQSTDCTSQRAVFWDETSESAAPSGYMSTDVGW